MASGEIQLQNISLYSPRLSDSAHTINDAPRIVRPSARWWCYYGCVVKTIFMWWKRWVRVKEMYIEAVLSVLAGHFLPLVFNWFFKRNGHIISFVEDELKLILLVLIVYFLHNLEAYNMTVSFEKPIKNQRQKVARQNRKHSFYVHFLHAHPPLSPHKKLKQSSQHTHNNIIDRPMGEQCVHRWWCVHYRIAAVSRAICFAIVSRHSPSLTSYFDNNKVSLRIIIGQRVMMNTVSVL